MWSRSGWSKEDGTVKDKYRLEKRYNWTQDILAWGHGKYSEAGLRRMTMPELGELHFKVYMQRLSEINAIRK